MSGRVARKGKDTNAYKILIENNKGKITLLRLKCLWNSTELYCQDIEAQSLSWFVHVQRMPDNRTVKKMFKWNPLTKR